MLSPLCSVFTIMYLQQTMMLCGYRVWHIKGNFPCENVILLLLSSSSSSSSSS